MARRGLTFRLWDSDNTLLGEWREPTEAYRAVREAYTAHPNPTLLYFGAFTKNAKVGAKPAFSVSGTEILSYLNDVDAEE